MDSHSEEEKNRNMASLSPSNYCYIDQIHNTFAHNSQDIFNLATGMENMITYPPSKPHLPHDHHSAPSWKDLLSSSNGASSSKSPFYNFTPDNTDEPMLAVPQDHNTYVDDSSLRCVFPCEGNERPSQGLSLSLSSANPSAIGLQSFELRHPSDQGFFPKPTDQIQQSHHDHNMALQEGYFGKSTNPAYNSNEFFQMRASKYLGPAQDLLNEFCNLGSKETGPTGSKAKAREHESAPSPGTFVELQKRKGKLLAMLEEVDRRYRHYCNQMKAVVSSFEAVAGNGAATIYSEMASKAMSRHFRALRDGIVSHIKSTKKAMGEKDTSTPGMTRGETPRLRVLDQTLRQQRAFQQMSMMESHPWRPQRGLPERSVSGLRAWLFEHFLHPYPSDVDKHILARQTGLSRSQVSNWFINARVRLWKPMVEEMYLEETKEQDNILASNDENNISRPCHIGAHTEDQKPTLAQLGRIDSECLSSIIINPDKNDTERHHHPQQNHNHNQNQNQNQNQNHHHGFGRVSEPFGAVELDFSSYGHHQGFGNASTSGTGVSLTLGLQQHGENGVSLAFASAPQGSLFYPRAHMEDCQTVQFNLLDGEAQNLPYRNLMGAQMMHDLAG